MRRFSLFVIVMIVLSLVNITAANPDTPVGEVLYHQDFSEISNMDFSGIKVGTQSTESAFIGCPGEDLSINVYNKGRVYLIFPQIERGDTYTVEFDFSFEAHENSNGYIAFMLNCRGDEPTNVSSVVVRYNGTVDDFVTPDPALSVAISSGETVHVTIPIENNALYEIVLEAGGSEYTLLRNSVLMIPSEGFGLEARNANVNIREVYITNGVGYTEKNGYYA